MTTTKGTSESVGDKYNLLSWQARPMHATIEKIINNQNADDEHNAPKEVLKAATGRWDLTTGIRPVDLYVYLKARFGEPNGITMISKNHEDSDNLIHWHYSLETSLGPLDFICWSFRLEIWHPLAPCFSDPNDFLLAVKQDFSRFSSSMKEIRKGLEKWKVFLNPYFRLKTMIETQLQELEDLRLEEVKEPIQPRTVEEAESFTEAFSDTAKKFTKSAQIGLGIRMLTPVWAESFVNLLLFVMARPEVRGDKRLYDGIMRQNIDLRIRGIHLNCVGFVSQVKYDEWDACKKFHSMMNRRNDLLHGNVDPELTTFDELYFEKKTPLYIEFKDFSFFSYKATLLNVTPEQALEDYQTVQDLASHILLCIDCKIREDVVRIVLSRHLGWDEGRQRVGILFPDHLADAVFSFGSSG
ncbi:MAG: hypothetical protein ACK546_00480 [bacterium]|jgi:hypothetical protein